MLDQGLSKVKLPGMPTPVFAAGPGETVRFFGPHVIRRSWGCELLGTFGIEVPPLRRWLSAQGHEPRNARLSYYMTNEMQFISPVAVMGVSDFPPLRTWIAAIRARVLSLPSSLDELVSLPEVVPQHLRLLRESVPEFWASLRSAVEQGSVLTTTQS